MGWGSKLKRKVSNRPSDTTGYKAYRVYRSWQRSQPPQADAHVKAYRRKQQRLKAIAAAKQFQINKAKRFNKHSQGARFMLHKKK